MSEEIQKPAADKPQEDVAKRTGDVVAQFDSTVSEYKSLFSEMEEDFRFKTGDQWSASEKAAMKGRPMIVLNRILKTVKIITGFQTQNFADITVSANGTVSRGVCRVEDGWLRGIHETLKIQLFPDGSIADVAEGQHRELAPDTVVSMNFWGFMPSIFQELEAYFDHFLRCEAGDNIKAECLLPGMVGDLLEQGRLEVSVLHSADRWFGMTYHEDKEMVQRELQKLHDAGVYPKTLRA